MMNQRIKELAKQQGLIDSNYILSSIELEKFAQAIILECATVARNYTLEKYPKLKDFDGIVYIEEAIKEHFK
jgi:hypothetical protein